MNVRVLWSSFGWPEPPTLVEVARRLDGLPWMPVITESLGTEAPTPAWHVGNLVIVSDAAWGLFPIAQLKLFLGKDSEAVYDVPEPILRGRITER